jgi:hypothetical protein
MIENTVFLHFFFLHSAIRYEIVSFSLKFKQKLKQYAPKHAETFDNHVFVSRNEVVRVM